MAYRKISISLPPDVAAWMDAEVDRLEMPVSAFVLRALAAMKSNQELKRIDEIRKGKS